MMFLREGLPMLAQPARFHAESPARDFAPPAWSRPSSVEEVRACADGSGRMPESKPSGEFAKRSSLYKEFLAEREEILRHKWLESERLGYDIGFDRAMTDWIRKHRESWRANRR